MIDYGKIKYMNTRQKGYYRDKLIVETIDNFECLTTEQIYYLFFFDIKHGIVKCRERLRQLRKRNKIVTLRLDINECSYHFIDKKPYYLQHNVNRNWGFMYIMNMVKMKYQYLKFDEMRLEYYMKCGIRTDGIIGFKNYVTGEYRYWILESDKADSKNKFNKIKNYNDKFGNNGEGYKGEFWFKRVERFPHVLIICDNKKKKDKILNIIIDDNVKGLKFIVVTIDEIKKVLGL